MTNNVTLGLSLAGVALLELFYASLIWSMLKHRKRLLVNARSPILAAVQGFALMPFGAAILVQQVSRLSSYLVFSGSIALMRQRRTQHKLPRNMQEHLQKLLAAEAQAIVL
jgi:hypothetical protein